MRTGRRQISPLSSRRERGRIWEATGDEPQGLMLGLLLFNTFANDVDDETKKNLSKTAGDAKLR